ncbi:hypothetical protein BDZ85DRAFT_34399 [Elsinoe ampelina]|uniref:Uncharacterized protein n=1 Tax=Elsinoe ampelina TaxID=302913 RepID=A0A6A6G3G9_9PEZI|nr:hypothetical protein BDZ85DRAFT_34399 [Elsinoe ampelina]
MPPRRKATDDGVEVVITKKRLTENWQPGPPLNGSREQDVKDARAAIAAEIGKKPKGRPSKKRGKGKAGESSTEGARMQAGQEEEEGHNASTSKVQPSLLTLLPEIRLLIYDIILKDGRGKAEQKYIESGNTDQPFWDTAVFLPDYEDAALLVRDRHGDGEVVVWGDAGKLAATCRKVREELPPMLYAKIDFSIETWESHGDDHVRLPSAATVAWPLVKKLELSAYTASGLNRILADLLPLIDNGTHLHQLRLNSVYTIEAEEETVDTAGTDPAKEFGTLLGLIADIRCKRPIDFGHTTGTIHHSRRLLAADEQRLSKLKSDAKTSVDQEQ